MNWRMVAVGGKGENLMKGNQRWTLSDSAKDGLFVRHSFSALVQ